MPWRRDVSAQDPVPARTSRQPGHGGAVVVRCPLCGVRCARRPPPPRSPGNRPRASRGAGVQRRSVELAATTASSRSFGSSRPSVRSHSSIANAIGSNVERRCRPLDSFRLVVIVPPCHFHPSASGSHKTVNPPCPDSADPGPIGERLAPRIRPRPDTSPPAAGRSRGAVRAPWPTSPRTARGGSCSPVRPVAPRSSARWPPSAVGSPPRRPREPGSTSWTRPAP